MTLQVRIKKDLTGAMKAKNAVKKDALRVVLGEFARAESKELPDKEVVKIIKKLIKSEKEVMERTGASEDSEFIQIIETYLPRMASAADIKSWIAENIDLTQFKNKMQAMGPIMQHFGDTADGDTVKRVLQDL